MARQTTVHLVDDLDGTPADETVSFALDGKAYEIDLSPTNAETLRDFLALYIDKGRRAIGAGAKASSKPRSDRAQTKAIREWAKGQGFELAERGRIPEKVLELYQAAN